MISVRKARAADAPGIALVHVLAWRGAYAGILPDRVLLRLSQRRQTAMYERMIGSGAPVHVAVASGADSPGPDNQGGGPRIVGFASASIGAERLADGEIETLYVHEDFRERGLGRRLLRAAAADLATRGCRSAFLWVLADNPSRWFYARLGGRHVADGDVRVGGEMLAQAAYLWDPIETLTG